MTARHRFILREACTGAVLNALLSYGIFRWIFGDIAQVPVRGFGYYLFDFLPQGFMVALMSALVPSLIARRAAAQGRFPGQAPVPGMLPQNLLARSFVFALGALIFLALPVAALGWLLLGDTIVWNSASALKMTFGAGVSLLVTPIALSAIIPAE